MDAVLMCECGFQAYGDDEDAVVELVRLHADREHGMTLTTDDARRMVRSAQPVQPPVPEPPVP